MMDSQLKVKAPGEVVMELTMSMTLNQWIEIKDALKAGGAPMTYGSTGVLCDAIWKMTQQAHSVFKPEE